ncbi:TonB-dependent receptor plug [Paludibacter propionicigenes WB4]|uniref:TonB-dependent receptor plug n=1 Tax=Paludibacter propionicigenes (strain DSM 17365 / JCM 13257 / WB4) TaxID=694427 RepID=E4T4A2_PALPW|nr:TonB-dependent receptor [Paludibacter propionicigenes]ADQ79546.1 TonB-dependent receptor plug [Paludibacter propionicigenes WB4]
MKNKGIILFLVLFFSFSAFAQKGTVKGKIFDIKSNQPLEFAAILIQGTDIGTTADANGDFTFVDVEPGFKRLVVSLTGFQIAVSEEFQVQGNQTSFINVGMSQTLIQLGEVTVRQNFSAKKIESPISVLSVGVQEIEKTAGATRDVSKVIQTLPGVGATDPNRNDLIVRGGGPSENVFYLDGIEIPTINHFATQGSSGGSIGVLNPDFIQNIDFYTGAFPAGKVNALSSVMDIKQKDGSKDKLHTKLSVGASDAALTLDGPLSKNTTFIVSARQSYLQFLFSALKLPFLPTYNDFQVKVKTKIDQKNEITFLGIGAIDDDALNTGIKNPTESQAYILSYLPTYKQWNYTVGAVYKHFADRYYDTWVLSRNMLRNTNFKYRDNNTDSAKISDYKSDEAENKLRFERNYPDLPVKLSFGGGVKYAHYTNYTNREIFINNTVMSLLYNTKINLFGYQAFAQASKQLLDNQLKLSLGVNFVGTNYNDNMMNPLNQFSPRFSVSYALSPDIDLNANIGRYAQQPAYTTLGYRNSAGDLVNKNENLRYTISNQAIAGFEYRPMGNMKLSMEAFYKHYDYYPLSVADGMSIASKGTEFGQVGDEEIISRGKGRAYGVEILYKIMEMKKLNLTATYTFFRSEFTNSAGVYVPSSWDTKHLFNLISSYKFRNNWYLAIRWRYVGGAPYTPIDPVSANKSVWNVSKQPLLDYTKFNSLRLPNTQQLDIRIDKEFYLKKMVLNLYADIQNVYNFQTQGAPIYTNLDTGTTDASGNKVYSPNVDPTDSNKYLLRTIDNFAGRVLPTIGIIVKI